MTATITPLEALLRLIAEVKQLDAVDVGARWNQLQGELGVAEGVARDYVEQRPVLWDVVNDGEHCLNCFPSLAQAEQCKTRLDLAYPNTGIRAIQPLYAAPTAAVSAAPSGEVERDAARYRWLLSNYAFGDGFNSIDDAMNNGEADKYLSVAIDAAHELATGHVAAITATKE